MALGGIVRGKKVTLRTPVEADLALVSALMADMRVRRGGQVWDEPAAVATWKERLKEAAKDERSVLWTIEADGAAVGMARVSWHSEPGHCDVRDLVIDPERWGRGYGGDAALALHRYLFDYLDRRVTAVELPTDNERAKRIAERLGFVEFARGHDAYYRDGAYLDRIYLRLDRETWDAKWGSAEREYAPFPEGIER